MAGTNMELIMFLMEALKKQGLSFLILGAVVIYFHNELNDVRKEVKLCNDTIVEIYSKKTDELKDVIIRNTEALNKIESRISQN